jgi:hypothetical protein
MTLYGIHDNGGRPFAVKIDGKIVDVYKYLRNVYYKDVPPGLDKKYFLIYDEYVYSKIKTFRPKRIFVGKSPKCDMTDFSGGIGKEFDGNSILLDMGNKNYIFIGHKIFKFTAKSEIAKFVSPVGNNDVPYPFAIDDKNNFYDILFGKIFIIPNNKNPHKFHEEIWGVVKDKEVNDIGNIKETIILGRDADKKLNNRELDVINYAKESKQKRLEELKESKKKKKLSYKVKKILSNVKNKAIAKFKRSRKR